MPTVVIEPKHCKNTIFDSLHDDALARALAEQHPEIQVKRVNEDSFVDKDGVLYNISKDYTRNSFYALKNKEIQKLVVEFAPG